MPSRFLAITFLNLLAANGCMSAARRPTTPPAALCGQRGVVITVDGAGGYQATSESLRETVAQEHVPLAVATYEWTHGFGRVLADQMDYDHAVLEGRRLAATVQAWKQLNPQLEIHLISHSAGSAVVLAAAEALPPNSVDRILLLAPAVSMCYDLRPALACARKSVDVFHSDRDWFFLGVGTSLLGTSDGEWGTCPAGRCGFQPILTSPADACLYRKLRQHPWHPAIAWTGNHGGHYGAYQPGFLKAYILPLLLGP